jgi:hypothetical protein
LVNWMVLLRMLVRVFMFVCVLYIIAAVFVTVDTANVW